MYRGEDSELPARLVGRQRTAGWVTHAFREHNEEADAWTEKGAKRRVDEWVDTARVV